MPWLIPILVVSWAILNGPGALFLVFVGALVLAVRASLKRAQVHGLADQPLPLRRVIDGDTFEVEAPAGAPRHLGGKIAVRLAGVDAWELGDPGGKAAKRALAGLLGRGRIQCSKVRREKYGRALAVVKVDGKDVARELIREGHGRVYHGGAR